MKRCEEGVFTHPHFYLSRFILHLSSFSPSFIVLFCKKTERFYSRTQFFSGYFNFSEFSIVCMHILTSHPFLRIWDFVNHVPEFHSSPVKNYFTLPFQIIILWVKEFTNQQPNNFCRINF